MAACGDCRHLNQLGQRLLSIHTPSLSRRWYFFVPEGVNRFQVISRHGGAHRQDSGLIVCNPHGQPVGATFASRLRQSGEKHENTEHLTPAYRFKPGEPPYQVLDFETDPGSTGRFWSIWGCGGDGHWAMNFPITVDGVPPYFASMPEQWFNPQTGRSAEITKYDYVIGPTQRADETLCPPCPLMGDTDTGMRGAHAIYLRNDENLPFDFHTSWYLTPPDKLTKVHYRAFGPGGEQLVEHEGSFKHASPPQTVPLSVPAAGAGTYKVEIDAEQWYGWPEPSMPMVLTGNPTADGGCRFSLQLAIGRHWFFSVPRDTKNFRIRAAITDPDHVLHVEIHAPDRLMDMFYVRGRTTRAADIDVPAGLDGRIWFLRLTIGSPTRIFSKPEARRMVRVEPDIDLIGVPGYIAPTWEQWFNPEI